MQNQDLSQLYRGSAKSLTILNSPDCPRSDRFCVWGTLKPECVWSKLMKKQNKSTNDYLKNPSLWIGLGTAGVVLVTWVGIYSTFCLIAARRNRQAATTQSDFMSNLTTPQLLKWICF